VPAHPPNAAVQRQTTNLSQLAEQVYLGRLQDALAFGVEPAHQALRLAVPLRA